MLSKLIAVCSFFVLVTETSPAPVEVKNGGDLVFCKGEAGARFQGYFVLDYLAGYDAHEQADDAQALSLHRISHALIAKLPEIGHHFDAFLTAYFHQTGSGRSDPTANFVWRRTTNRLVSLKDEELNLISQLDRNCYSDSDQGMIELKQAVVRQNREGVRGFIFNYDEQMMDLIKANPLQESYLVVHEWLWNFVPFASSVREINAFLHSPALYDLSPGELRIALANHGFAWSGLLATSPRSVDVEVFDRHQGAKIRVNKDPVVVGQTTERIRFLNRSAYELELVIADGRQSQRFLVPQASGRDAGVFELDLSNFDRFPAFGTVEVQPMLDPLSDIVFINIFR